MCSIAFAWQPATPTPTNSQSQSLRSLRVAELRENTTLPAEGGRPQPQQYPQRLNVSTPSVREGDRTPRQPRPSLSVI